MIWIDPANLPNIRGWMADEDRVILYTAVRQNVPADVVEIGVYCGRTTWALATACAHNGFGTVHSVDPWPGDTQTHDGHDRLHDCMTMLERSGLVPRVQVHCTTSAQFAAAWRGRAGLVMIDGEHTPQAVAVDLAAWWPRCDLMYGHDRHMPEVATTATEYARANGLEFLWVPGSENLWTLRRRT